MFTLRDIYLELGDIFHFPYEKNQNGSYRVNTVIRNLVYPDLYMSKSHNSNDICYYLANPDFSYQAYPNIRNSFSELMNPKKTGNRFPVIYFCDEISIPEMYRYYESCIVDIAVRAPESYKRLSVFLNNIFDSDPSFYARLKLSCNKDHEFLTWVVIFAMFNAEHANEKYEKHLETFSKQLADVSISESGQRHKLSTSLILKKEKLDKRRNIMYMLCTIEIFFAFLPFILPNEHKYYTTFTGNTFCLLLLGLTFLILLLRIKQAKSEYAYSDLQTYHDFMDEIPDEEIEKQLQEGNENIKIIPLNNKSNSNLSRNHFRSILKITLYVLLTISILVSLLTKSFPILLTWVSISIICLMFIDRFYNDYSFHIFYDKNNGNPEGKPNHWRGLSKIYKWEYEKTRFDIKNPYYKTVVHVHSGSCYRHIFLIARERLQYNLYIYNVVLVYFTAVFLILEILTVLFGDVMIQYLRLPDAATFHVIISMYILAIGLYTLTTMMTSATNYEYLSKLSFASRQAKQHPEWAEKLFLNLHARGIIRNIDWMRGVFTYNMACFEQNMAAEEIFPESDRMQFYHRHIVFRSVAKITIALSYVAALSLLVWHFQMLYLLLPITVFCISLYIYLYYDGLNKIHRKRIINEINQLSSKMDCEESDK